jgi:hypothetical protein
MFDREYIVYLLIAGEAFHIRRSLDIEISFLLCLIENSLSILGFYYYITIHRFILGLLLFGSFNSLVLCNLLSLH